MPRSFEFRRCVETGSQLQGRPFTLCSIVLRTLLTPVARLIARIIARSAEAQLHRLDDRMLKDIGLSRSEIASAVRTTTVR